MIDANCFTLEEQIQIMDSEEGYKNMKVEEVQGEWCPKRLIRGIVKSGILYADDKWVHFYTTNTKGFLSFDNIHDALEFVASFIKRMDIEIAGKGKNKKWQNFE